MFGYISLFLIRKNKEKCRREIYLPRLCLDTDLGSLLPHGEKLHRNVFIEKNEQNNTQMKCSRAKYSQIKIAVEQNIKSHNTLSKAIYIYTPYLLTIHSTSIKLVRNSIIYLFIYP